MAVKRGGAIGAASFAWWHHALELVTHLTNGHKDRLSGTLPDSRFLIRR